MQSTPLPEGSADNLPEGCVTTSRTFTNFALTYGYLKLDDIKAVVEEFEYFHYPEHMFSEGANRLMFATVLQDGNYRHGTHVYRGYIIDSRGVSNYQIRDSVLYTCNDCGFESHRDFHDFWDALEGYCADSPIWFQKTHPVFQKAIEEEDEEFLSNLFDKLTSVYYESDPSEFDYCPYCGNGNDYEEAESYHNHYLSREEVEAVAEATGLEFEKVNLVGYTTKEYAETPIEDRSLFMGVKSWDYRPSFDFQYTEKDTVKPRLYLGVELEMDKGGMRDDAATLLNSIVSTKGLTYFMRDGSLNEGMEIATMPSTLSAHKTRYNMATMMKAAATLGYRSHDTQTCGIHVHVNKAFFGDDDQERLYKGSIFALLVERFWEQLVPFSRRRYSNLESWAKKKDFIKKVKKGDSKAALGNKFNSEYSSSRYVSLNVTNRKTFELRIFKGTLKYETYMATLELVHNMAHWVKDHELKNAQVVTFKDIIDYKPTEYLVDYCKEKGIYEVAVEELDFPEPERLQFEVGKRVYLKHPTDWDYENINEADASTHMVLMASQPTVGVIREIVEYSNGEIRGVKFEGDEFIWHPQMLSTESPNGIYAFMSINGLHDVAMNSKWYQNWGYETLRSARDRSAILRDTVLLRKLEEIGQHGVFIENDVFQMQERRGE